VTRAGALLRAALVAGVLGTSAAFAPRWSAPLRPAKASASGAGACAHANRGLAVARARGARAALRAAASREAAGVRSDDSALRNASAAGGSTPGSGQDEAAADSLDALRMLRAEKLAAGETVFFDFPAIIGGDETAPEAASKPLLLYLTGMDGLGVSGEPQFADLSRIYEVRRLQVLAQDRSTFDDLVAFVLAYVDDWQTRSGGRNGKVVLMGESFGGMLATGVAITNRTQLQGLVLANPATSFDRTDWPTVGPFLASIPSRVPLSDTRLKDLVDSAPGSQALLSALPLPVPDKSLGELAYAAVAGGALFARALDQKLAGALVSLASGEGSALAEAAQKGQLQDRLARRSADSLQLLDALLATLPADTVAHRLDKCLGMGALRIKGREAEIDIPVIVIAGSNDNILPSAEEADRLVAALPQCTKIVVRSQGHLVLDAAQNVTRILVDSPLVPKNRRRDPVEDFVFPSAEEAAAGVQSLEGV